MLTKTCFVIILGVDYLIFVIGVEFSDTIEISDEVCHNPCNYPFFTVREEVNLKCIRMNAVKNLLGTRKFLLTD